MRIFLFLALAVTTFAESPEQAKKLVAEAKKQIGVTRTYDPNYTKLDYPGGDVPVERGVCTDVVIRAFRKLGLDLQQLVHEDMARSFEKYPQQWSLRKPDTNIDHRRVPNLMRFFERAGKKIALSKNPADFQPGDLVACLVPPHLPHIMIVSDVPSSADPKRLQVIHNIGGGAQLEDRLFDFELTGHYRYWSVP